MRMGRDTNSTQLSSDGCACAVVVKSRAIRLRVVVVEAR